MEREIKYRAWDKAGNKMCEVALINFKDKLSNIIYDNKSDYEVTKELIKHFNVPFSRIELMQYIGIKDKKGKEIYEGDIVEWTYPENDDYHKEKSKFGNVHGVVYWNDEYCLFSINQISRDTYKFEKDDAFEDEYDLDFYDYDGMQFGWNELEVIGNIYENKECYERELENYKKENWRDLL